MTVGKLVVAVVAQTKSFTQGLARTRKSLTAFAASVVKIGAMVAVAMAAAATAAIVGMVRILRPMLRAAAEVEQEQVKLAAVLRATGYAAGLTIGQLNEYEEELERMAGGTNTAVVNIQTLLLTFRKIKGDVFREATEAVLDMAIVMDTSATSAALQLGKALNDPIIGLTALRRVGVSFSETQIEQIKNLVRSNRIMQAQIMILEELRREFGGAARAMGVTFKGRLDQLRIAISTLLETIGLPIIDQLTPILKKWTDALYAVVTKAEDMYIVLSGIIYLIRVQAARELTFILKGWEILTHGIAFLWHKWQVWWRQMLGNMMIALTDFFDHAVSVVNWFIKEMNRSLPKFLRLPEIPEILPALLSANAEAFANLLRGGAKAYSEEALDQMVKLYAKLHDLEGDFQEFAADARRHYLELVKDQFLSDIRAIREEEEEDVAALAGRIQRPAAMERGTVAAYSAALPGLKALQRDTAETAKNTKEMNAKLDTNNELLQQQIDMQPEPVGI